MTQQPEADLTKMQSAIEHIKSFYALPEQGGIVSGPNPVDYSLGMRPTDRAIGAAMRFVRLLAVWGLEPSVAENPDPYGIYVQATTPCGIVIRYRVCDVDHVQRIDAIDGLNQTPIFHERWGWNRTLSFEESLIYTLHYFINLHAVAPAAPKPSSWEDWDDVRWATHIQRGDY